ncbi:TonB family protein [Microseira sp. BLCC-F43]|uniref:TonB family protein n=1 Tax=Microseira sp. BLCC-F43 TaxID=3153602 RepID=UPI0035B97D3D
MKINCNMSLSVIGVNQREKEEEELRSFLTYSLLGSVVFHALVLFIGTMLWDRQPALADNPIEVIMVDAPAEETPPPSPKVSPSPPAPSPSPVVTPQAQQPKEPPKPVEPQTPPPEPPLPVVTPRVLPPPPIQAQQPKEPPKPVEPQTPPPEPPPPVVTAPPIQPPRLALPQTPPPEPPQPVVTPTTPVVPEPEITPPPEPVAENLPPTPKQDSRPVTEPLRPSTPKEPVAENTPSPLPDPVAAKQPETPQRLSGNSRPLLPAPREDNKLFRDEVTPETSRDSVESSDTLPTLPQQVAVNRPTPPQRQTAQSQALPGDTGSSRQTRPSLDSSEGFPGASIPENEETFSTPTAPGTVAVNRGTPPQRRVAQSQALPGSTGGSRQSRPSLDNSSDFPGGSIPEEDATTSSSVVPGTVAVNRGTAPRRPVAGSTALPGSTEGSRQSRPSLDNSSDFPGGSIPGEENGLPSSGLPGRVAVNRGVPPRPPSNAEPGTDDGGDATEVDGEGLNCLSSCKPEYPRRLAQRGVEGRPVIRFVLDPSGRPMNMQLAESSGDRDLDGAAIEAVRKMRFAPPGSRPLRVRMGITFTLGG